MFIAIDSRSMIEPLNTMTSNLSPALKEKVDALIEDITVEEARAASNYISECCYAATEKFSNTVTIGDYEELCKAGDSKEYND